MTRNIDTLKFGIKNIYGNDERIISCQLTRYGKLDDEFVQRFGEKERAYFSAPGRAEICGNHTDHNHGLVLTASINLDSIAVAAAVETSKISVYSEQYEQPFEILTTDLNPKDDEVGTTTALIRGIVARFQQLGYKIGGFEAYMTSAVLPGSGLSSSASVEVLFGTILNALFNENSIAPEIIAQIGQYSENRYFGKPCGLMDQMASAVGGIITIDFKNPEKPLVQKVDFDFSQTHFRLLVVDTGGNHLNLTPDYASVPAEMSTIAQLFDAKVLRDIDKEKFIRQIPELRGKVSDRAILRAFHFFNENDRVLKLEKALEVNDFTQFLQLINESGNSSFKWLQNTYSTRNVIEQGVPLALALTEKYITEIGRGACRIHGGGFAGTILAIIPDEFVANYTRMMRKYFGENCCYVLDIRSLGAVTFK